MKPAAVHDLIDRLTAVDTAVADRDVLTAGLDDVRRVTAWCESRQLALAAALAKHTWFPEKAVGDATCTDTRAGEKTLERARTAEAMPALGDALGNGDVSGEHLDIVTRAIRDLTPALQPQLTNRAGALAQAGRGTTPAEFRRIVNRAVRDIQTDDGMTRLTRQTSRIAMPRRIDAHRSAGWGRGPLTVALGLSGSMRRRSPTPRPCLTRTQQSGESSGLTTCRSRQVLNRANPRDSLVAGVRATESAAETSPARPIRGNNPFVGPRREEASGVVARRCRHQHGPAPRRGLHMEAVKPD